MAKIPECPYCGAELVIGKNTTAMVCNYCGSDIRIHNGGLYKMEEMPPEVSCCFVGLFANIVRAHEGC